MTARITKGDLRFEDQARRLEARRASNPEREARRQAELTRMQLRSELIPWYTMAARGGWTLGGFARRYLGMARPA